MPQQLLADSHVTFALAVQRNGIDIGECGGGGCGKTANVNHSLNGVICDVVCVMVHQGSKLVRTSAMSMLLHSDSIYHHHPHL